MRLSSRWERRARGPAELRGRLRDRGAQTCTTSYYRSDDEVASKEVAREYCGADGLARIDAAEQNVNALSQCDMAMCWLDLQEVTHDGTWVWSDGSTPGYLNWNSQYDQPDDGYGPEADAIMNAGDVGGLRRDLVRRPKRRLRPRALQQQPGGLRRRHLPSAVHDGLPGGLRFPGDRGSLPTSRGPELGLRVRRRRRAYGGPDDLATITRPASGMEMRKNFAGRGPRGATAPRLAGSGATSAPSASAWAAVSRRWGARAAVVICVEINQWRSRWRNT